MTIPTKLLTRHGVAVAESGGTVTVLTKGETSTSMSAEQFDRVAATADFGPPVSSAAGRLWAANRAMRAGVVKGKWSFDAVESTAGSIARSSLGTLRGAVVDGLALGLVDFVGQVPLTASELAWYRARHAAHTGADADLVRWLEELPPHGYPDRISLLAMRARQLLQDAVLADRARSLLEPFAGRTIDARALRAALSLSPAEPDLAGLVEFAGVVARSGGPSHASLDGIAAAIASGQRPPVLPQQTGPALPAWDSYLAGRTGSPCADRLDQLGPLPAILLDELIAAGALSQLPEDSTTWSSELTAYVRCRLDPGGADTAMLTAASHTAELARRRFLAEDDAGLARLPDKDPVVRHYRALRAHKSTGRLDDADGLRAPTRAVLAQVEMLRSAAPGGAREVPELVAADPSVWPLLQDQARRGEIAVSDQVRTAYPEFGSWLDLYAVQRLLFDQQWDGVLAAGRQLVESSRSERIRDEVQNMIAFAQWQLGRSAEALRLLREALEGEFSNGLVVNAALVAAEQGCLAALPYLDQAMRLATDQRVRQGALGRALTLWLADPDVPDYPAPLAEMVRSGLSVAQPDDEFHCMLLLGSALHDPQWLAEASPTEANPAQAAAVRYFRTRARVLSDRHQETLDDVAKLLVSMQRSDSRPWWLEREQTWLTDLLLELVHTDFGEAVGLVPPIETLVRGGVLNLYEQIVLTTQAGAHLAVHLNDAGENIAPAAEQRLIFGAVQTFRGRRAELPELVRDATAEELARCVAVSALAMTDVTGRYLGRFAGNWDALVTRRQWDYANGWQIIHLQASLLSEMDEYLTRCRSYLSALDDLPLSESQRQLQNDIRDTVNDWTREHARLSALL